MAQHDINIKDIVRRYGKDIAFGVVGIVLTIILIVLFIQSVGFLVTSVDSALSIKEGAEAPVRFNIQGLQNLGLGADVETATSTP